MAKLDNFIIDGTTYEIVPEIAPLFNESDSYSVGDCVIKDAVLYRFTANHTGAWTGNDAEVIEVADRLNKVSDSVAPEFNVSTSYAAGSYVHKNGVLYRFTADHAASAWTGTDAVVVTVGREVEEVKNLTIPALYGNVGSDFPIEFENGTYYSTATGQALQNYYGGGYDLTRKVIKTTTFNAPCKVMITAKTGYAFTVFISVNGVITGNTGLITSYVMKPGNQYGMTLRTTGGTDNISALDASQIIDVMYINNISESVAPEFSNSAIYARGQHVYKDGRLYRFTASHTGEWIGTDAEAVTVGGELANINIVNVPSVNLYDNDNPTIINGFLGTSGMSSGQTRFSSSSAAKCLVLPVEASTIYTMSKTPNVGRASFGFFTSIPSNNDIGVVASLLSPSYVTQDERYYMTFTTPPSDGYIILYYYNSNDGIAESTIRASVMFSEGNTLYPYIPYGNKKLLIIEKENINDSGTAGQALMLDEDGETLIWGTPAAQLDLDDTLTQQGEAADAKATGDAINAAVNDIETQLGQVVISDGVQTWLDEHPEVMIVIKTNGDADDTPELGTELLSSTGWTSTGWTGDFANGFTHTTGNTNPLSVTIDSLEENALYQFTITTSNAATNGWSDFYVSVGGSPTFETYKGGGASVSYVYGIICGSTKVLTITPRNDYTGTVTSLSLKKVTNSVGAQYELTDTDGNVAYQVRTAKASKYSVYAGKNSGAKSFWGYENVSLGIDALASNTSGFWNTAIGRRALQSNQNGSRNIAIGYIALRANTGGDRNVAVGTFALEDNTTGRGNTALNADALQDNTTGSYNTGIGVGACVGNKTGSNNVGIGRRALASNETGSGNIAIGLYALEKSTGSNNIAIGNSAADESGVSGSNNIVIGANASLPNSSGSNQLVIGDSNISTVEIAGKIISFNQDGSVTWS